MQIVITHRRSSRERGDEPTLYALNVGTPQSATASRPTPVGEKLHQGGGVESTPPPWGKNSAPQQKSLDKTGGQEKHASTKSTSQILPTSNTGGSARGEMPYILASHVNPTTTSQPRHLLPMLGEAAVSGTTADSTPTPLALLLRHHPWTVSKHARQTRQERYSAVISPPPVGPHTRNGNRPLSPRTSRPERQTPRRLRATDTSHLDSVITEFSSEFRDELHLRSNRSQARNLLASSGAGEASFVMICYEARSRMRAQGGAPARSIPRNQMAYFFAVLRELLHTRRPPGAPRANGILEPQLQGNAS
jgi:hypothetical protein